MDYKKYKFKFRLLVIHTDNYQNEKYKLKTMKYEDSPPTNPWPQTS